MEFNPNGAHNTSADGFIFQAACLCLGYDWSQHGLEFCRETVEQLDVERAAIQALEHAHSMGEPLNDASFSLINESRTNGGSCHIFPPGTTEFSRRQAEEFKQLDRRTSCYMETMYAMAKRREDPSLGIDEAIEAAKSILSQNV